MVGHRPVGVRVPVEFAVAEVVELELRVNDALLYDIVLAPCEPAEFGIISDKRFGVEPNVCIAELVIVFFREML